MKVEEEEDIESKAPKAELAEFVEAGGVSECKPEQETAGSKEPPDSELGFAEKAETKEEPEPGQCQWFGL